MIPPVLAYCDSNGEMVGPLREGKGCEGAGKHEQSAQKTGEKEGDGLLFKGCRDSGLKALHAR